MESLGVCGQISLWIVLCIFPAGVLYCINAMSASGRHLGIVNSVSDKLPRKNLMKLLYKVLQFKLNCAMIGTVKKTLWRGIDITQKFKTFTTK